MRTGKLLFALSIIGVGASPVPTRDVLFSTPSSCDPALEYHSDWLGTECACDGSFGAKDFGCNNELYLNGLVGGAAVAAFGFQNKAVGVAATVFGSNNAVTNFTAVAMGNGTWAQMAHSVTMGDHSQARGESSTAMGHRTSATSFAELVIGQWNELSNTAEYANGQYRWDTSGNNAVFRVGIGTSAEDRVDALTVYKNGDVYIKNLVDDQSRRRLAHVTAEAKIASLS